MTKPDGSSGKKPDDEEPLPAPDDPTVTRHTGRPAETRELDINELSNITGEGDGPPPRAKTYVTDTTGSEMSQPTDRFTLTEVLGEGSQGEVCRAFDNHLQRNIAIKFPHRGGDDTVAQEILDEARKAARLNHPNVVTIYECGHWKGRPYIAMEFVDGASLASIIKDCGRISVERFVGYADQILRALEAAHAVGLFHRDLKPHNVLMSSDGTLKLTDFGIAHLRKSTGSQDRTMRVEVAGTPAYMAPEQWMGQRPDGRTDIYAFGCMAYKLLCGRAPFPREEAAKHHLQTPPPPLRRFAPHVPEQIEAVIMRCLQKEPSARYQTCAEVRIALASVDAELPDTGATVLGTSSAPVRRSSRALFVVIAVLVIGGGLTAFLTLTRSGRDAWDGAVAALGLGPAVIDEEGAPGSSDDVTPGPGGGGDETPGPDEDTETERRLEEARGLLVRARAAESPDQAIQLAERAAGLADADPALVDEIAVFLRDARERRQLGTEEKSVAEFEAALASIRDKRTNGDLEGAWADVLALEKRAMAERALRNREVDVRREKLPLAATQGTTLADEARFDEAADRFDLASKIADSLGDRARRDGYRRSAELTRTLHRLSVMATAQPRYVLVEMAALGAEPPFRSAEFLRARAWNELGFTAEARRSLQTCLDGSPGPALARKARDFMQTLR